MPTYNEEKTVVASIGSALEELRALEVLSEYEVIVVNDGSDDKTAGLVSEHYGDNPRVKFISKEENRGKGAAVAEGVAHARCSHTLIQDADLEYSPNDYGRLLGPVLNHDADAVYGSRFKGEEARVLYFWHFMGNRFLTFLSNMFSNLNLTDMETCYKLVRTEIFRDMVLESRRFGIEPEITAKLAKIPGIKIYEVAISYHGRTYAEGKKVGWKDGISAIFHVLRFNLFRNRKNSFKGTR